MEWLSRQWDQRYVWECHWTAPFTWYYKWAVQMPTDCIKGGKIIINELKKVHLCNLHLDIAYNNIFNYTCECWRKASRNIAYIEYLHMDFPAFLHLLGISEVWKQVIGTLAKWLAWWAWQSQKTHLPDAILGVSQLECSSSPQLIFIYLFFWEHGDILRVSIDLQPFIIYIF